MEKNSKIKTRKIKKVCMFLIFQIIIVAITVPIFTFYGPFNNIKRTIVGTAMFTMRHQKIATTFMSKDDIDSILKTKEAMAQNEDENLQDIDLKHKKDNTITQYEVHGKRFDGYVLEIKDSKRVKVGTTKFMNKRGQRTSEIAKQNGGIAAINGGGFNDVSTTGKEFIGTGAIPEGIVISNGEVVSCSIGADDKAEVAAFDKDGGLIVGKKSVNELKKLNVTEAVSFNRTLIKNGKPLVTDDGGQGIQPRTAIAQKQDGTVLMLVIDGRDGFKQGASLREIQDLFLKMGAWNAANLDGGSSSTMYYNEGIVNRPSDKEGERTVATVMYVKE
jgi:exopolysaccharide biosynthesis protein